MRPTHTPQDPDYSQRVHASFGSQAMMRTFGIEISDLGPGWVEVEFPHNEDFTQQNGYAHAAVIAAAMDSACGYAAYSLTPPGSDVLTVEYKINLLRPGRAERYVVHAWVVKPGRTLTVCQASAQATGDDHAIAVMTATVFTTATADRSGTARSRSHRQSR